MKELKVKSIRALARGIEVLQLLQASGAMTLHSLHLSTELPKATLLRILKTLTEQGVIWQRMVDNAYVPSYSLTEMAHRTDREQQLVEIASPVLEQLSNEVRWPSVLVVPRFMHMAVLETNASRTYFDNIKLGPVEFRVNLLRSASGRAYFAHCEASVQNAILETLRRSRHKGDWLAHTPDAVHAFVRETRARGFALRDPDFGGDFNETRAMVDDGRNSLGVAICLENHVLGAINITWAKRALELQQAVELLANPAKRAAGKISELLIEQQEFHLVKSTSTPD